MRKKKCKESNEAGKSFRVSKKSGFRKLLESIEVNQNIFFLFFHGTTNFKQKYISGIKWLFSPANKKIEKSSDLKF